MLVVDPLTYPVRTVWEAVALAQSTTQASPDAATGPALDRIARYLNNLGVGELIEHHEAIGEVLSNLTDERAERMVRWLIRRTDDPSLAQYWRKFILHAA